MTQSRLDKDWGVYLDIKSTCSRPFSEVIQNNDEFIISQWPIEKEEFKDFGQHQELAHVPGGEFQQWNIIAAPHSPFLKAVIDNVAQRISNYSPWKRDGWRNKVSDKVFTLLN